MDRVGVSRSDAPSTIKGTVERMDSLPTLAVKTQVVPAIDQIMFGVQANERFENGTVTITVNHPPLGSHRVVTESWDTEMETSGQTVHAYYLGLSDGDPVGRWSIVATVGNRKLFMAEFDVVPAGHSAVDPCHEKPIS